jgi:hypothetical protein
MRVYIQSVTRDIDTTDERLNINCQVTFAPLCVYVAYLYSYKLPHMTRSGCTVFELGTAAISSTSVRPYFMGLF